MTFSKPIKIKATDSPRLNRDAWLDAAFHAVVEGGFDNVRVLVLAERLGVTRGSFYWHFEDHAELIDALLQRWLQREEERDALLTRESDPDPIVDMERLLDVALSHGGDHLENLNFELALRGLGRRDEAVGKMVLRVDQSRLKRFEQRFLRLCGDAQVAADMAALFYLTVAGSYQALARPGNQPHMKEQIRALIRRYMILPMAEHPMHADSG